MAWGGGDSDGDDMVDRMVHGPHATRVHVIPLVAMGATSAVAAPFIRMTWLPSAECQDPSVRIDLDLLAR